MFMLSYNAMGTAQSNRSRALIWLGIAAAGSAFGMIATRRQPAKGGILGAVAGLAAGSIAVAVCERARRREDIPFYSSMSPQYSDSESI